MASQEELNSITQDDVVIAVMGPTGVGKSSFIRLATENDTATIGHSLRSQTDSVQLVRCSRNNKSYVFLDTPGFNDTTMTDADVLTNIVYTLKTTYQGGIKLAGVIYLRRISDNRMTMTDNNNIEMFTLLCGPDALKNVTLVTTMWDQVEQETGESRERQLHTAFWRSMVEGGSRMMRFTGTHDSAWDIVDQLNGVQRPLQIQRETVDQGKNLSQTAAGNALFRRLTQLVVDLRKVGKRLKVSLNSSKKHSSAYQGIQKQIEETTENLSKASKQKAKLEPSNRSFSDVLKGYSPSSSPIPDIQYSDPSRQSTRQGTQRHNITPVMDGTAPTALSLSHREVSNHPNETTISDEYTFKLENITKHVTRVTSRPVAGGGFSDIYQGKHMGYNVAIKVIRIFDEAKAKKIERRLVRELGVWRSLEHPNIVPLLGYVDNMNRLPSPVSPWYRNGDAFRYLEKFGSQIEVKSRLQLLLQVAAGLRYLHQQEPSIIHGDLKPANILIDDDGSARLCDFGLARLSQDGEVTITGTVMLTRRYAAPELYSPKYRFGKVTETTRTDIYSLACVGYQFLYLKRPYANKQESELIHGGYSPPAEKSRETWHPAPQEHVSIFWDLFEDCWLEDESKRPDIDYFYEQMDGSFSHLIYVETVCSAGGATSLQGRR